MPAPFSASAPYVTAGRRILRCAPRWPWTDVIVNAFERLRTLMNPG